MIPSPGGSPRCRRCGPHVMVAPAGWLRPKGSPKVAFDWDWGGGGPGGWIISFDTRASLIVLTKPSHNIPTMLAFRRCLLPTLPHLSPTHFPFAHTTVPVIPCPSPRFLEGGGFGRRATSTKNCAYARSDRIRKLSEESTKERLGSTSSTEHGSGVLQLSIDGMDQAF